MTTVDAGGTPSPPSPPSPAGAVQRAAIVVAAGVVLSILALLAFGSPAANRRLLLDPGDGSVVGAAPAEVTLTLGGAESAENLHLAVTGPTGAVVSTGRPAVRDGRLVVAVRDAGPGAYRVAYRARLPDGRQVSGLTGFTVTSGAVPAGPVAAPIEDAAATAGHDHARIDGINGVLLLLDLGLVAVALLLMFLRPQRGRGPVTGL
ncbi:copper resistance CopC family protein [Micromonospora peucetia]|uniref:Copper resistance protein CopC n=1 Tax=Micromonospora peucetia TaxID=47871 RepID=A0ABZ1EAC9_9ACTN|nr:copper resistance CopC family protein [Micromonospora peucetia]WSA31454.1 copper resistance protein CopC [Micromonospora peucetia]